jgi:hypothetical protein
MSISCGLRHGRGGWYLLLANAFRRFCMEVSYVLPRDSGLYGDGMPFLPLSARAHQRSRGVTSLSPLTAIRF